MDHPARRPAAVATADAAVSIRLRLTLLYSAILALTLAAFGLVLYLTVATVTRNVQEQTLVEEARRLIQASEARSGRIILPASRFAAPATYVQTYTPAGEVTDGTPNLGEVVLPITPEARAAIDKGKAWVEPVDVQGQSLLIYAQPLEVQDRVVGIVQVARSMSEIEQALATLRLVLGTGSAIVLIVAFGAGWALSGLTLRSINRLTQTAASIGAARDFNQRVVYHGPNDELGRLATTFNAMLTALQAAYHQVEQALETQRRFVADASHELRTPLTTIRGNLALLQRDPPITPADREEVLRDLTEESERLSRLVNDLLVLARAEGSRSLPREPVAVGPILVDVCRQARRLAPTSQILCSPVPEVRIQGNRDALKQILLILIDNAIKATHRSGTIVLAATVDQQTLVITVEDNGPGIPAPILPHIFDRFYRGDPSRTSEGTGLGLAIARALVAAQDSSIAVETSPAQGTVFTLRFPVIEGPAAARKPAEPDNPLTWSAAGPVDRSGSGHPREAAREGRRHRPSSADPVPRS